MGTSACAQVVGVSLGLTYREGRRLDLTSEEKTVEEGQKIDREFETIRDLREGTK